MSLSQKLRSAFAIATVFILVIATNQLDKQYYNSIKESMRTIHADRLVAKGYLYELNSIYHQKQIKVLENKGFQLNETENAKIDSLMNLFENTKFIKAEKYEFMELKRAMKQIAYIESKLNNRDSISSDEINSYCDQLKTVSNEIDDLAAIQIGEGENQIRSAQMKTKQNEFLSQIELWIIIALGIVFQFLIFYKFKS